MKTHSREGGKIIMEILKGVTDDEHTKIAYDIATYHHERWNGKGYPEGLAGEQIPLCARLMAFADVFNAVTMERVYKKAFPVEVALGIMEEESGEQFDPLLTPIFVNMIREEMGVSAHCTSADSPVQSTLLNSTGTQNLVTK